MKIIRLIVNLVFFAAGAGLGVYWGVNHPSQAADIARREKIASLNGQIKFLAEFGDKIPNGPQMLEDDKKALADAESAGTQP